jgi:Zn-dependent protease with chaperone function
MKTLFKNHWLRKATYLLISLAMGIAFAPEFFTPVVLSYFLGLAVVTTQIKYYFSFFCGKPLALFPMKPEKRQFIEQEMQRLCTKAQLPLHQINYFPNRNDCNAEFLGSVLGGGKTIFTAGYLKAFDMGIVSEDMIRATMAHELGHSKNGDEYLGIIFMILFGIITAGLTMQGIITAISEILLQSPQIWVIASSLFTAALGLLVIPILFAFMRAEETGADLTGAAILGNKSVAKLNLKHFPVADKKLALFYHHICTLGAKGKEKLFTMIGDKIEMEQKFFHAPLLTLKEKFSALQNILNSKQSKDEKTKALLHCSVIEDLDRVIGLDPIICEAYYIEPIQAPQGYYTRFTSALSNAKRKFEHAMGGTHPETEQRIADMKSVPAI